MENSQEQKPKKVEELKHFPFKTFAELKKATIEGVADIGIDRGVALQWAHNGIYSSRWTMARSLLLALLPFAAAIGFVIYIVVLRSWLLLLGLPVLFICFFIFHPSTAMTLGIIRSGLIGIVFIGLAWGLISGIGWLTALTSMLAITWYAQRTIYRKASNDLTLAVLEHEDLFCLLWEGRAMNIRLYNGDSYWSDWKTEGEQSVHYDDK